MAKLTWQKNGKSQKVAQLAKEHKRRKQKLYALYASLALNVALLAYVILIK